MPMARAEQYRNLYPFLEVGAQSRQRAVVPPSPHPLGFGQLSPTPGLWTSNPEAFAGRGLRENIRERWPQ